MLRTNLLKRTYLRQKPPGRRRRRRTGETGLHGNRRPELEIQTRNLTRNRRTAPNHRQIIGHGLVLRHHHRLHIPHHPIMRGGGVRSVMRHRIPPRRRAAVGPQQGAVKGSELHLKAVPDGLPFDGGIFSRVAG